MVKLEPWYKVVTPRKEVREGRSFDPKEFAIHLEQVVNGTAPEDYANQKKFFERTCFTQALKEHVGMILKRLSGETVNTSPVLTLITQFGGGKTHTLTTLYHIVKSGKEVLSNNEIKTMLFDAGLFQIPKTKVAVFVGSAWDPQPGRDNPWIDIAWQLAGNEGIKALGPAAKEIPPGTEALQRLYKAAGGSVLILFDETLNYINRYRKDADAFYAYIQNLTISMTATTHSALVMSLPRSQIEMTEFDIAWQDKITKLVRRVAKDLFANDEAEISEVIRKRLFEDIGDEKVRKNVSKAYADWCFDRRNQLPSDWMMIDSTQKEANAREMLRKRFEACYPFHPATLSVFQRKWQNLPHYQQTRGTLAMLAQWISWAYRDGFRTARKEALITIGSAPLDIPEFRAVILGQLGDDRLKVPIETDIAGAHSHARALDVDTKDNLKDIHRRVGSAILFESSGGIVKKVANLPEIRFALIEPDMDTTSIDSAALALESKSFFIRKIGTDGFQIKHEATMKKVVSDKRASLDEDEIKRTTKTLIKKEFEKGKGQITMFFFPEDGSEIPDTAKFTIIVIDPDYEWQGNGPLAKNLLEWTKNRGPSPRLYPYSLVWFIKKRGRDLREKVEYILAWEKVKAEADSGQLGSEIEKSERMSINSKVKEAAEDVQEEIWASYRFVVICDDHEKSGLKEIDLGAGHASGSESLSNRVINALKAEGKLTESVGAGYLQRNWPPALKESGAWPLSGLRQSFLDGSLTRLLDPDETLRTKIIEFVKKGDFGLGSGSTKRGGYYKIWFKETVAPEEIVYEAQMSLLTADKANELTTVEVLKIAEGGPTPKGPKTETTPAQEKPSEEASKQVTLKVTGVLPSEIWNRFGTKVIPKIKQSSELTITVEITTELQSYSAQTLKHEIEQILNEMGLKEKVNVTIK